MADVKFIRDQIRRILSEKTEAASETPDEPAPSDKKKEKGGLAKVKPGRGRVKAEIQEAEALANSDPKKLMKRLKIDSAPGDSTPKKVAYILKRAVNTLKSTKGLEQAYSDISLMQTEEGDLYVRIIPNKLKPRDALLYMNHTLVGAVNSGILAGLDMIVVPELDGGKPVVNFRSV